MEPAASGEVPHKLPTAKLFLLFLSIYMKAEQVNWKGVAEFEIKSLI